MNSKSKNPFVAGCLVWGAFLALGAAACTAVPTTAEEAALNDASTEADPTSAAPGKDPERGGAMSTACGCRCDGPEDDRDGGKPEKDGGRAEKDGGPMDGGNGPGRAKRDGGAKDDGGKIPKCAADAGPSCCPPKGPKPPKDGGPVDPGPPTASDGGPA